MAERSLVLFDEYPYFSQPIGINHNNLCRIESALKMGLSNDVKEKEFITEAYDVFKAVQVFRRENGME